MHDVATVSKSSVCREEGSRERAGGLQERQSQADVLACAWSWEVLLRAV